MDNDLEDLWIKAERIKAQGIRELLEEIHRLRYLTRRSNGYYTDNNLNQKITVSDAYAGVVK